MGGMLSKNIFGGNIGGLAAMHSKSAKITIVVNNILVDEHKLQNSPKLSTTKDLCYTEQNWATAQSNAFPQSIMTFAPLLYVNMQSD